MLTVHLCNDKGPQYFKLGNIVSILYRSVYYTGIEEWVEDIWYNEGFQYNIDQLYIIIYASGKWQNWLALLLYNTLAAATLHV